MRGQHHGVLEQRSKIYEYTAMTIAGLERAGCLRSLPSRQENVHLHNERKQLAMTHGTGSLFEGEVLELVTGRSLLSTLSQMPAQRPVQSTLPALPSNINRVLEAVRERDHELSIAHFNEASWKLGIEMSLAEVADWNMTTASVTSAHIHATGNDDVVSSVISEPLPSSSSTKSPMTLASAPGRL